MKIAYLILCNGNPQAVTTLPELVEPTLASLKLQLFREIRNSPTINDDANAYDLQYVWTHQPIALVTLNWDPEEYALTRSQGRTHVPETFPQPQQTRLPSQVQLKRVQLPTNRETTRPATTASTHSHPEPGVPQAIKDQVRGGTPPTLACNAYVGFAPPHNDLTTCTVCGRPKAEHTILPAGIKCPVCEQIGEHNSGCPENPANAEWVNGPGAPGTNLKGEVRGVGQFPKP